MSIAFPDEQPASVVLVVEDEPVLRAAIARGLRRMPNVDVVDAATVSDAMKLISACRPSMMVSDLDLPDGSGLDLLGELERVRMHVPVLFVSAFVPAFKGKLPTRRDVEVMEKPVAMETLRQYVSERVGRAASAPASPFGVADYVQLAGMGRRSVVLEIASAAGGDGRIDIRAGEIWSARDGRGVGLSAFRRLAFLEGARIVCRSLDPGELGPRTIEGSCDGVLLEAARLADECAPIADDLDDWETVPATSATSGKTRKADPKVAFDDAYERGVDALLARDHPRALVAFQEAAQWMPEDPRVIANLSRLRAMGYT